MKSAYCCSRHEVNVGCNNKNNLSEIITILFHSGLRTGSHLSHTSNHFLLTLSAPPLMFVFPSIIYSPSTIIIPSLHLLPPPSCMAPHEGPLNRTKPNPLLKETHNTKPLQSSNNSFNIQIIHKVHPQLFPGARPQLCNAPALMFTFVTQELERLMSLMGINPTKRELCQMAEDKDGE